MITIELGKGMDTPLSWSRQPCDDAENWRRPAGGGGREFKFVLYLR